MEPLFFKAENPDVLLHALGETFGFNGAAFFQSGKCNGGAPIVVEAIELQWSRFFSKRKIKRGD